MKKLYEVEFTVRTIVAADDEIDAHRVVENDRREIVAEESRLQTSVVRELKTVDEVRTIGDWCEKCYPYGIPARTTIAEILAAQP